MQNKQENKKGKLHYIGGRNGAKDITKITESLQLCYKMSKSLARKNGISYNVFSKRESAINKAIIPQQSLLASVSNRPNMVYGKKRVKEVLQSCYTLSKDVDEKKEQ